MPGFEPQEFATLRALDRAIDLPTAAQVAAGEVRIALTGPAQRRCSAAAARLAQVIAEERHVYGITTGFGPLANRLIDARSVRDLQQNLVHHLATGTGPAYGWQEARAIVLARLMSILQGQSGASAQSIDSLVAVLNSDLAPEIAQRGTVGASGDLTPLAHLVLCLQGRGRFLRRDGTVVPGAAALGLLGLAPLDLSHRDGLALVNGTSAMTGVAVCNSVIAGRLVTWLVALTACLAEVMRARAEAWCDDIARARPHAGQARAATALRQAIAGSRRVTDGFLSHRRVSVTDAGPADWIGQDAYTLRCAPQIIGAAMEAVDWHDSVLEVELNSATDNPIFPADGPAPALHGGNFMGSQVALVSDALALAVTTLAGLAERQVARLCDERLNGGLPAFLHQGLAGLNSGLMGAQVSATALLAEMRSIGPACTQSISTNGANQDVVSMGTIAARLARDKLALMAEIVAILGISVAQAMDITDRRREAGYSPRACAVRAWIRDRSVEITEDRPLGEEIAALGRDMAGQPPPPA